MHNRQIHEVHMRTQMVPYTFKVLEIKQMKKEHPLKSKTDVRLQIPLSTGQRHCTTDTRTCRTKCVPTPFAVVEVISERENKC